MGPTARDLRSPRLLRTAAALQPSLVLVLPFQQDVVRTRPHRAAATRQSRLDLLRLGRRFRYLSTAPRPNAMPEPELQPPALPKPERSHRPRHLRRHQRPRYRPRRQLLQLLRHPSPGVTPLPTPPVGRARLAPPHKSHVPGPRPQYDVAPNNLSFPFFFFFEKYQRVAVILDPRLPLGRSSPRRDLSTSHTLPYTRGASELNPAHQQGNRAGLT
jgi:hypothetical protein